MVRTVVRNISKGLFTFAYFYREVSETSPADMLERAARQWPKQLGARDLSGKLGLAVITGPQREEGWGGVLQAYGFVPTIEAMNYRYPLYAYVRPAVGKTWMGAITQAPEARARHSVVCMCCGAIFSDFSDLSAARVTDRSWPQLAYRGGLAVDYPLRFALFNAEQWPIVAPEIAEATPEVRVLGQTPNGEVLVGQATTKVAPSLW